METSRSQMEAQWKIPAITQTGRLTIIDTKMSSLGNARKKPNTWQSEETVETVTKKPKAPMTCRFCSLRHHPQTSPSARSTAAPCAGATSMPTRHVLPKSWERPKRRQKLGLSLIEKLKMKPVKNHSRFCCWRA